MNWLDRSLRKELRGLDVPDHRPGFWDGIEAELEKAAPDSGSAHDGAVPAVVPLKRRPRRDRVAPWVAASAAAAVVLVLGVGTALLVLPDDAPDVAATATSLAASAESDLESLSGAATSTAEALEDPPWSSGMVREADVPAVLVTQWQQAENQQWCAALVPGRLGAEGADAEPRAAEFGGGWAVAWDKPSGLGQNPDGTDCEDCGRSAFGIAGVGMTYAADTGARRAQRVTWSDGSRADWGGEGFEDGAQKRLADVVVEGQGCIYQVWSNLGDDHLLGLIESLRYVEGLDAGPLTLRKPGGNPETIELGDPPWDGQSVERDQVDPLVLAQWRALGVDAPRLVLAGLGEDFGDATTRTWGQGVAWDRPAGPGHTGSNVPCVDCGRGVIGIGWQETVEPTADWVRPANRLEWSDGSYAEYGGRLADPALPRDRVRFLDPDSGEWTVDALLATIHVDGMPGEVVVWTHLGEDHLLELISQLRFVAP